MILKQFLICKEKNSTIILIKLTEYTCRHLKSPLNINYKQIHNKCPKSIHTIHVPLTTEETFVKVEAVTDPQRWSLENTQWRKVTSLPESFASVKFKYPSVLSNF